MMLPRKSLFDNRALKNNGFRNTAHKGGKKIECFVPVICVRCDEKLLRAERKQVADVGDVRIQCVEMPHKKVLDRNVLAEGGRRHQHIMLLKQMARHARGAAGV